jgi:hypothetical protein
MQDIVNILIQNNIDINNTNINTNIVNQLVPVLIKTGDISTPEEKSRIKPVLIRYDDDDIKLYSPRILNPEMSKEYIELFSKVESNGLVGDDRIAAEVSEMLQRMVSTGILLELSPPPPEEERPPGDDTPPPDEGGADEEGAPEEGGEEVETDALENAMEGSRGMRWEEKKLGPLTMAKLKKRWPNRKSRNRRTGVITRTVMKFYYVFDKTLVSLDEEIGVDSATTQALAKLVINKLKKSKRVKLDTADLQKLVARAAKKSGELQGKEEQIIDALAQMNVVSDAGRRELAEGKTLSRWKVLSGIR